MKLQFISSPPLMVTIDGEKRALDISFRDLAGSIVALPTARRASAIVLSTAQGMNAAWQAWRDGFEVAETPGARQVAQQLVAAGVARSV